VLGLVLLGYESGLGFCHGKKYFCQNGGKTGKTMVITGKNRNKLRLA